MIYVYLAIQTQTHTADQLETEAREEQMLGMYQKVLLKANNWLQLNSETAENGISAASELDEGI